MENCCPMIYMGTERHSDDDDVSVIYIPVRPLFQGLVSSMKDPALKVEEDDFIVIIKDKYPKAEIHYLILPKEDIEHMGKLRKKHITLLRHMESCGRKMIEKHPNYEIRLGFHVIPSMSRLHLHVISQDFNSSWLRTKDHWNSFTTSYFISPSDVISELKRNGYIKRIAYEAEFDLLGTPLKCHKCSFKPREMSQLKTHLATHLNKKH